VVKDYLELAGALTVIYCVFRFGMDWQLRPPREEPYTGPEGKAIDASILAQRVDEVRQDHSVGMSPKQESFKRPQLVKERQAEIARMAFFQKPPPPEPPPVEPDHGWNLLVV
jgi:hypothetical protein